MIEWPRVPRPEMPLESKKHPRAVPPKGVHHQLSSCCDILQSIQLAGKLGKGSGKPHNNNQIIVLRI